MFLVYKFAFYKYICYNNRTLYGGERLVDLSINSTLNKLILLFIFDKMDFDVTEDNILNISSQTNNWMPWMECKETISQLLQADFIYKSVHDNTIYYRITPDGRMCLCHYYTRIPSSMRAEITNFVKEQRMNFKRNQEYFRNYYKNPDGTYTVQVKIADPSQTTLELKIKVSNRHMAKLVYNKWEDKAANIYYMLHEQLVDN